MAAQVIQFPRLFANDDGCDPTPPASGAVLRFPTAHFARRTIEAEIERLIAVLDALDGDPDLEPEDDIENDEHDGCEPDESRPEGIVLPLPQYAIDQSIGPINLLEADRYFREQMRAR